MVRLWLTSLTVGAIACVSLGCANQNLQGRWRGPFPLEDAKACVLNLYGTGRFDLACENDWIAGGRYEQTEDRLRFTFEAFSRRKELLPNPSPMEFAMGQKGNELKLFEHHGPEFLLRRGL